MGETGAQSADQSKQVHWAQLTEEEVRERLDSGDCGLTFAEAERRLEEHGPNEIETEEGPSWVTLIIDQVKNPLVLVLVVAAIISLLAGEEIDAIVIGVIIVVNTFIGFIQEYRAERALQSLKERAAPEASVVRYAPEENDCIDLEIPAREVVPGDVILIGAGDKVPADARLVHISNLEVDESMLTGESVPVSKSVAPLPEDLPLGDRTNLVYGGTIVTQGRGRAIVVATGPATEMGKIATMIQETGEVESPLQRQTRDLTQRLGLLALFAAAAVVVLGLIRGLPLEEVLLFALASAVSSIPEGLPAVMTITLAVGVSRMARRNAIIRRLRAVDTLGAATVITSDKTGTLTTNEMTVRRIRLDGRSFEVTGVGFEPEGRFEHRGQVLDTAHDEELRLALHIGTLCNDARLARHDEEGRTIWHIRGDPTEGALVVAAAKGDEHKEGLEQRFPRIDEIPFRSETKYMTTFHDVSAGEAPGQREGEVRALVKGAPETVLALSSELRQDGEVVALTEAHEQALSEAAQEMARQGCRVLGLAYRDIPGTDVDEIKRRLGDGQPAMIFTALVGMMDPARPEVPEAVERCRRAGIRVVMATGDHGLTAEAIAREIGILSGDGRVLTGGDVEEMSDAELDAVVDAVPVFARVSPEHKYRLVEALRRQGHVVAMTGDGVNDAPALKAAEIGIAMGITGTDVTKETAEMVLTDDNFASIVNAVEEGRVVFQNVRKVVKFLLSTNIGEDLVILSALAFLPSAGLIVTPVQILWVNLVTDGLLDITIALEPREGDVMDERPRSRDARIVNREILQNIAFVALFMVVGVLGVYLWGGGNDQGPTTHTSTLAFTTLAMFQVFNALNCRSRDKSLFQLGLFSNPYLIAAILVSVLLQVSVTLVPFLQTALGTAPLSIREWAVIVLVASTVFIGDEVRKLSRRRRKGNA